MSKLLIVEDEWKLLRSLRFGLAREGFDVVTAGDGPAAFERASHDNVDAVVLDLMLPGEHGLSVLGRLRDSGNPVPVLILTARGDVDDRVRGLNAGADDYLVKPFAFQELLARLHALLRRDRAADQTQLHVGDLEIDILHRRATRAGRELDLSNRQFELLTYLARHARRPVSREEILRDVWRDDSGIETNVVEVSINHLRRKVERTEWPPLIVTIRGAGYELRDVTCDR